MITQDLSPRERRMDCYNDIIAAVPATAILWSTDEAHSHLSGVFNKHNCRYWATEIPRQHRSPKVTVSCAGITVTVNSNWYCDRLTIFLRPKIEEHEDDHILEGFWFQQDGVTAYTGRRP